MVKEPRLALTVADFERELFDEGQAATVDELDVGRCVAGAVRIAPAS